MAGGMGCYKGLTALFGAGMSGFPSFEAAEPSGMDYPMMIVYILAGCVLAWFYNLTHHGFHHLSSKLPAVAGETLAGLTLGVVGAFVPMVMFSGEGEMHELRHIIRVNFYYIVIALSL